MSMKNFLYSFFIKNPYASVIVDLFLIIFLTAFLSNTYTFEFDDREVNICFVDDTETITLFLPKEDIMISTETKIALYANANERFYSANIIDIQDSQNYFIINLIAENYWSIKKSCNNEINLRIYSERVKLIEKLYD